LPTYNAGIVIRSAFICRLTFLSFRRGWFWRRGNKYVNGGAAGHGIRCSRYGIRMVNCRLRGRMMRGRWLDFRFETRFSRGQEGLIGGWLNLEAILDYRGPRSIGGRGYPARGFVYFKTGLYRDEMREPMRVYFG
jgi:hypothetical protein